MADPRRALGCHGEDVAAEWYETQGYSIVARNWRVRAGEIDLIALKGKALVVCEVKTRSSRRFGSPFEAVTRPKQRRIRGLALQFLDDNPKYRGAQLRFDVAAVEPGSIEVMEAAF
ncbi:MAG: YraN family protein [Acidimicrobiales bacterium]